MSKAITKITRENALEVFTSDKLDVYLHKIEERAMSFVPDISNNSGRKQVASIAHNVAKKKVEIDRIGKELVTDWKNKAKKVDVSRRKSREFLDELKHKVRKPLTEYEEAEAERQEKERLEKEYNEAHIEAIAENELYDRQKEIERKEAELKAKEEAELEKKRKAEEEKARIKHEEKLKREAIEKSERKAAEKLEAEKRARIESEYRAKQELKRAAEQAEVEKQDAINREKAEAEAKERRRITLEVEAKKKAERKAANIRHQKRINREALESFIKHNVPEKQAKKIISLIANKKIKHISINY